MRAQVRVDGEHWLDRYGAVGDLEDSTIWRDDAWSGDHELSCTWAVPADFSAPWMRAGARVEVVEGGVVTWAGFLADPEPGSPWRLSGFGAGADAANYHSTYQAASAMNANVDAATARGWLASRYANDLTGGAWNVTPGDVPIMLDEALTRSAKAAGKVWWVSVGEVSLRTEDTTPTWLLAPGSTYLGTTDEELVTDLVGFYVSDTTTVAADDGTSPPIVTPSAWSTVTVGDADARAKYGRREQVVDLTALGELGSADAAAIVTARFAQVGARTGWTNGFEMNALNAVHIDLGVGDPMLVRAGQRVLLAGLTDARSSVTYRESVEVTLGKVRRLHDENRAVCEPVGLVARDFSGALAAAQPPQTNVERI